MAIAGTIERSSAITLPRVLERIFDHEQPGSLQLKHKESGKTAEVKIDRGAVEETTFGDLKGDLAMREISQTFPWEYEFVSSDTSISTGRLPMQPASRPAKRPALKLTGAVKPMMVLSGLPNAPSDAPQSLAPATVPAGAPAAPRLAESVESRPAVKFMQEKSGAQPSPVPAKPGVEPPERIGAAPAQVDKVAAISPPLSTARRISNLPTAESMVEWVEAGDDYALRFACSDSLNFGKVEEKEWAYFHSDCASLMERASLIGEVLGFSPPSLAAIVEPERAAGYRRLANGFAGLYCGPGSTVDALLTIP